jgi:hypothetical protein
MGSIYEYVRQFYSGHECLGYSILSASIVVFISTFCSFIMYTLEKRRKRIMRSVCNQLNSINTLNAQKIQLNNILEFPLQLLIITCICIAFYSATIPFTSLGKLYFMRKYDSNELSASIQQR